jgi:TolB-like protein
VPFRECGFGSFRETEVVFAFGDHRLDPQRRELWRGSERVGVEPQVFDVLAYLVQHRDRVVSREDLLRAIWGGRIVSYSALASRINAVRRALGDDGTRQRLVRTFARKGVRFVGEVKQLAEAPASDVGPRPALPLPQKPSIAVLPFQNLSGEPEQEYFADGIVEEITTAIARFPWLFVIARNSSFTYKGRAVDVRQVARELGVRYVLEGSVRKTGNRVRITARLIDTGSMAHLWANRFDGTLDDIFGLQEQVALSVVGTIEPRLRLAEINRASRKPTESLEAYDFYLRGMAESYKRTRESLAEAIRLAHRALELDPNYALAMSRIALRRVLQLTRHWIPPSGPEVDGGIAMARRALAAASDDPEVLDTAGYAARGSGGRESGWAQRD